jgi:hypothetical protein
MKYFVFAFSMFFCLHKGYSQKTVSSNEESSTIAHFIKDAETHYTQVKINNITEPESSGRLKVFNLA